MKTKSHLKEQAIKLRQQGLTYREIMEQVPVAKATISRWLHSVDLAKCQKQLLTEKRLASMKRGAEATRRKRIAIQTSIMSEAKLDIGALTKREFWLMGTMLYWAEGSKEKEYDPGCGIQFTNTDPTMILFFIHWLKEIFGKGFDDLTIDLYIHEIQRERTVEISQFWNNIIDPSQNHIQHIYYKQGNPRTLRKNVGTSYHGTIRINVKASSSLNRKIAGWTQGVVESIR